MAVSRNVWQYTFNFSPKDWKVFLISVIVSGFILSFRFWGTDSFNATEGISNFIIFTLFFMIIYLIFVSLQKFTAINLGYDCRLDMWPYGPVIGLFITFISYGMIPFIYLGTVVLKAEPRLRLGEHRLGVNMKDLMLVGLAGPISVLIVLLVFLQLLYFVTGNELVKQFIISGAWILLFTSLPLPKTNGANVLLKSRKIWFFYFLFSLVLFLLVRALNIWAYVVAILLALLLLWVVKKFFTDKYL